MADTIVRRDYTTRDFDGFKTKLREYIVARFPNAANDFYEDHYLVVLNELMAYVGDQLAFYLDMQANEVLWSKVGQRTNITNLAKLLGYEPRGISSSQVTLQCTCPSYVGTLSISRGTEVYTTGDVVFEAKQNYAFNGDVSFEIAVIEGQTRVDTHSSDGTTSQGFTALYPNVSHSEAPTVEVDSVEWTEVDFLWDQGVGQYYEAQYLEDGRFKITFGDGIHGDIPTSTAVINITYRTTSGAEGNIGPTLISGSFNGSVSGSPHAIQFSNAEGSSGGADAESVDEIRTNAPIAFQSLGVVTTARDLKGFVDAVAGVSKSKVSVDPATKVVSVYVVADGYLPPAQALLNDIQSDVEEVLVIGAILRLYAAEFPTVDMTGRIYIKPNYSVEEVQDSINAALGEYFTPDDPAQSTKDVGSTVYFSDVVRLLDETDGVEYIELDRLSRTAQPETVVWSGNSTFDSVDIGETSKDETWTLTFNSPTTFTLYGSVSGSQTLTGTVGAPYTSDLGSLSLTILAGTAPNQTADYALIRTSRYLGNVVMDPEEFALQGTITLAYHYA